MASTGEVAAFGVDMMEAYWASLLSTNGFKIPKAGSGVLIGGDITKPEMRSVAKGLVDLGFKLYCSSPVVCVPRPCLALLELLRPADTPFPPDPALQ